ncbi:MAG TPA: Helicase associated domain protein [Galbitalea sp.]
MAEANKLVQLGAMTIEVEDCAGRSPLDATPPAQTGTLDAAPVIVASASWQAPLVEAVNAGGLSLDAADAIRRGLGIVDSAVTSEQLRGAAETLIDCAMTIPPEKLWRLARQHRESLDEHAIARGEKQRADQRYVRRFRRDGLCGGSWLLPDEEGGLEIDQALSLMLASRTGGPRFVDMGTAGTDPASTDTGATEGGSGAVVPLDDRTNEQVLADGFVQLMRGGLDTDPGVVPGKRRVAVRVLVTEATMHAREGHGIIEASGNTISFPTLEQQLCDSGTLGLAFDSDGQIVNLGREIRLFSTRQREALAARDGGCRAPGCEKPPSWTEAHHIDYWARDHGQTNIADGTNRKYTPCLSRQSNKLRRMQRSGMENVPNALESFSEGLARLIVFVARERHTFVPHHHQEGYFGLGRWVEDIREPELDLSDDQKQSLDAVPGWIWEVQDRRAREDSQCRFDDGLKELGKFAEQHGTARVPQMVNRETTALGIWVKTMRDRFKNGELSNSQIKRILSFPGWEWDYQEWNFLDHVQQFKRFVEANGHGRVTGNRALQGWVGRERKRTKDDLQPAKRRWILSEIEQW